MFGGAAGVRRARLQWRPAGPSTKGPTGAGLLGVSGFNLRKRGGLATWARSSTPHRSAAAGSAPPNESQSDALWVRVDVMGDRARLHRPILTDWGVLLGARRHRQPGGKRARASRRAEVGGGGDAMGCRRDGHQAIGDWRTFVLAAISALAPHRSGSLLRGSAGRAARRWQTAHAQGRPKTR
jgi:hypothetical protein